MIPHRRCESLLRSTLGRLVNRNRQWTALQIFREPKTSLCFRPNPDRAISHDVSVALDHLEGSSLPRRRILNNLTSASMSSLRARRRVPSASA